ncbi:MAG TPA: hypothetical protein VK357_05425 [Rubrobacteraceae bacterium]|nr:hypothetical protein [Rubrobacteraceae bacterium]
MRRTVVLLVMVAAMLALAGGTALTDTVGCTGGDCVGTRGADTISGTSNIDRIAGMEGNDQIQGEGGSDQIYSDEGNDTIFDDSGSLDFDTIYGDEGNDTILVAEGNGSPAGDTVDCGPGKKDKVTFDRDIDTIAKNCEIKKPQ